MHRLFLILTVIFIGVSNVCADITENFIMNFSVDNFKFENNETGELRIIPKNADGFYPECNEPGLPRFSWNIVTDGGTSYGASSYSVTKRLIKRNVILEQSPLPIPTDATPVSSYQPLTYDMITFPVSNCKYVGASDWGTFTVLHFISSPFIYDAQTKDLYFVDKIELTVTYAARSDISFRPLDETRKKFIRLIASDKEGVDDIVHSIPTQREGSSVAEPIDYVIITNNSLKQAFEPLLQWKRTKGLYSKILTIEEICKKYAGDSPQLKIKNCLYDLYRNNALKYVLLGGDDMIIPVRGCYGKVGDYVDNEIPTDLYYACFGGNFEWDGNSNNIFGEPEDNIDLVPDIYLTRIPVRESSHVTAFIQKLLKYEQSPIWTNNILMCGNKLWGYVDNNSKSDSEAQSDNLFSMAIKPHWKGTVTKFFDTYTDISGDASYDLTALNLKFELAKGYSFMDMICHGKQTYWELENGDSYTNFHGYYQSNISSTIVTTAGCMTNAFDSSVFAGDEDPCLSESLIRNPNSGIIAYLGCSRDSWGYPGYDLMGSLQYELSFYRILFSPNVADKNWGVMTALAKAEKISTSLENGSDRWFQFGLNPIGDPEMPVFIETPKRFEDIAYAPHDNHVCLSTGVKGCRISVMSLDDLGESYYKVFDNTESLSLYDLPVNSKICITKQGYIPKVVTVSIIQNETITSSRTYNADVVMMGSNLTSSKRKGEVRITGDDITISAPLIFLGAGTKIENNGIFYIK